MRKLPDLVPLPSPADFVPQTYPDFVRTAAFNRGVVRFDFAINEQSSTFLMDQVEALVDRGHREIVLSITSPGGDVQEALGLYDRLRHIQAEHGVCIEGRVAGYAASAAAMSVLQAAALRTAYPNSRFLLHEIFTGGRGKLSELDEHNKETKRLQDAVYKLLLARLTIKPAAFQRRIKGREWWMGAQEALEIGLIDRILNADNF